jgi:hypothetical protein
MVWEENLLALGGILLGPLLSVLVVSRAISGVEFGDLLFKGRGNVGLTEHLSDDGQNLSNLELWGPDSLENLLTNLSRLL